VRSIAPSRVRLALVLAAVLTLVGTAALRFGAGASDAAVSSTLHATVGPDFDISLTFDDGSAVGALPPGSYRVLVSDLTPDHNFHLYGPGVDQSTGVDFTGTTTWNVTFQAGSRYQYICDVHADSMFGHFDAGGDSTASSGGAGSGSAGGSSGAGGGTGGSGGSGGKIVAPVRAASVATLSATVRSAGVPKLTLKGKPVRTLAAGTYKLTVTDGSSRSAVELGRVGGGTKTLTSVSFAGAKTVGVNLTPGQWKLYPSSSPASAVTFRVTRS
jgi:hypothetical protein